MTVQPDVFVVSPEDAGQTEWTAIRRVVLVVEVLSASTVRHDRFTKRRLYQEHGVAWYWILDLETRRAEVWTPAARQPRYVADTLAWHPEGAPEPCVERYFGYTATASISMR